MLTDLKIEKAICGSLLTAPSQFAVFVKDTLTADHFVNETTSMIYQAIDACLQKDNLPNVFDVENYLSQHHPHKLKEIGGERALITISQFSTLNEKQFKSWVERLIELYGLRKVHATCNSLSTQIQDEDTPLDNVLSQIDTLSQHVLQSGAVGSISLSAQQIIERDKNQSEPERLFHNNPALDAIYHNCGSRRGQYEIIMGITAHAKSHLTMLRVTHYLASGHKVLWIQREDTDSSSVSRANSYFANVSPNVKELLNNFYISDRLSYVSDIKREARLLHAKSCLDVLVVDYIQRVKAMGFKGSDRRAIVDFISTELADLAIELNILVIVVSQLSRRKNDSGWRLKPRIDDLKESSQLEQDAFIVTSTFYPAKIDDLNKPNNLVLWYDDSLKPSNTLQIEILKHRHGLPHIYKSMANFSHLGILQLQAPEASKAQQLDKQQETPFYEIGDDDDLPY